MSTFSAGALVIGLLTAIGVPILWLIFRSGVPGPEDRATANRDFEFGLLNPDFPALAAPLAGPLPAALATLYGDRALILGQDWHFSLPNPGQRGRDCYVAYFQSATLASLRNLGAGPDAWLAFANDGAGDEYLADLRQADPLVVYLQHDTGKTFELAVTLAEFLRLPRRQEPDA